MDDTCIVSLEVPTCGDELVISECMYVYTT